MRASNRSGHRGVDGAAGKRRREVRADSGAEPQLQSARGAFRENRPKRALGLPSLDGLPLIAPVQSARRSID